MMTRRVPCLDPFINQVNLALWPRFQRVVDRHINSVRALSPATWGTLDTSPQPVRVSL